MKVKDVMHKGVTSIEQNTPVSDIAMRMRDSDIGAIAVKADSQLVGIVTDRDITCRGLANGGDFTKMQAKDVMTRNVVCCSPGDDVETAIEVMEAQKIRRLPVTNSRKAVVGMLSLGDISHKLTKKRAGGLLRAVSGHHG